MADKTASARPDDDAGLPNRIKAVLDEIVALDRKQHGKFEAFTRTDVERKAKLQTDLAELKRKLKAEAKPPRMARNDLDLPAETDAIDEKRSTATQYFDRMHKKTTLMSPTEIDNGKIVNDMNEDTSKLDRKLTEKQCEQMKTYYDQFLIIDKFINRDESSITEAEQFTQSILNELPSGDVTERLTACHIIKKWLEQWEIECLFFDSQHGGNLHDSFPHLAGIDLEDKPFVLKLSSCDGLGISSESEQHRDNLMLIHTLNAAIEQHQTHPIIIDIIDRLARAHEIDKDCIIIKNIYIGSVCVVYTVRCLPEHTLAMLIKLNKNLKDQFSQFLSAGIHPLLFRPSFDISYFDPRGNKTFPVPAETFQIGPPTKEKTYVQAAGWTRYGLNVLGKYKSGDYWLHPFRHPENWYRAYHGTGNAKAIDFGDSAKCFDHSYAPVDAMASIYTTEFRPARRTVHGPGVYCSPNPKYTEDKYVGSVQIETVHGMRKFKCMLQVAVDPKHDSTTKNPDIWLVHNSSQIRAYGILIKNA